MDGKRRFEGMDTGEQSVKRVRLGSLNPTPASCTIVSGAYKTATEDNNLFSNIEKMRAATSTAEFCYMPQAVPSLAQDPTYVDSTIQPSPKDSGVDMSSPERKLDDLGDLSSQESSPRIPDRLLHLDSDKGIHKHPAPVYTDIRDFNQNTSANGLFSAGVDKNYMLQGPLDSNMNPTVIAIEEKYQVGKGDSTSAEPGPADQLAFNQGYKRGISGNDSGNESGLDGPCLNINPFRDEQKSQEQEVIDCLSSGLFHSTDSPVHSSPVAALASALCLPSTSSSQLLEGSLPSLDGFDCEDGGLLDEDDIINEDGCTLAQLNMSQKSTEVDLQALLQKEMGDSYFEVADKSSSLFEAEDSLDGEDDLFATLNEDNTCSFTASGTPGKKPYLTPTGTPSNSSQRPDNSVCKSQSAPAASGSGFMAEFAKFLQQTNSTGVHQDLSSADSCQRSPEVQSKPPVVKQIKFTPLRNQKMFKQVRSQLPKKMLSNKTVPAESQTASPCHCIASSPITPMKRTALKRLVKAEKKLHALRKKVTKLLKVLFPDLDYPLRSKALCTVDILLDQILDSVESSNVSRDLEVIRTSPDSILDVRISLCKSPQTCIRHLRRKVCNVLEVLLPDLHLTWPFDREGDIVEDLVQEITQSNKS